MILQRPPILQGPVNVSGAPVPARVVEAAKPAAGLVTVAIVSAVAGYFIPKLLDRLTGGLGGLPVEYEEPLE